MSLPQFRRYVLKNNSGQTLTFSANGRILIRETAVHFNTTDGKPIMTVLSEDDLGFTSGTLADGAEIIGDVEISNASNLYDHSLIQIEIKHDEGTLADGNFELYLSEGNVTAELSTDGNGYNDAVGNGLTLIGFLIWESNGLDDQIMRSRQHRIG